MRNHKLLDKNTILGYILVNLLYVMIIYGAAVAAFSAVFGMTKKIDEGLPDLLGAILGGILVLLIWCFWFRGEFDGFCGSRNNGYSFGKSLATGIKSGWIMFFYWALIMILTFTFGKFQAPGLSTLTYALCAGIGEEIAFRSMTISYLMRRIKTNRGVVIMIIFTSFIFGFVHLANMLAGAVLSITIMQVLGAGCMGLVFAYAFLKSGNILAAMFLHSVTDFVCFLDVSQVNDGIQTADHITLPNYFDIAFMFVIVIWVVFRLKKPGELDSIREFWDRKWSRDINN